MPELPNKFKNATLEDLGISREHVNTRLNRRSDTTVGKVKADRLFKKNQRRMQNGLPPLPYDQI